MNDNSTQLNEQSRRSAKCGTPRSKSNAVLTNLPPLECTDIDNGSNDRSFLPFEEGRNDENNAAIVNPKKLTGDWSFNNTHRMLHISWSPSMNMSYYSCDQVQVQCVPTIKEGEAFGRNNPKEVYSKPLKCNNLTNHTLINVVRVTETTSQFCTIL